MSGKRRKEANPVAAISGVRDKDRSDSYWQNNDRLTMLSSTSSNEVKLAVN